MAVAPPALTRQQLLAVAAARGQQQPNADPYASIIGGLPKPETTAQIQSQAQGEISPLVSAITGQIGKQTNAATHAIGGYSADAAAKLAALNFEAPYTQGEQGQSAVDAALRQSLAGAGSTDADALASRLAVINDPSVAAAASTLSANGAANGNTQLAQGSAALGNLIGDAASAKSYGQKQPGIAQLAGLQEIASAQQNGQNNIASQTSQLEQQLPSIVNSLTSENDSRSSALTAARENQLARNDAITATTANNQTKVTVANIAAKTARKAAQAKAAETSFNDRLKYAKTYGVDPVTGQTLPGYTKNAAGDVVKATKAAATKGQLTDGQAAKLVQQWHDGKPTSVTTEVKDPKTGQVKTNPTSGKPITETKTAVTGNLNYGQAYAMLRNFHYTDVHARALLNTVYAKGDSGRAWVTNEEQAALQKAGVPYKAKLVKAADGSERGLLGPGQYRTLKSAGILPPGQLTAEGWFVIAPGH